jgi:hypothetical protein
MKNRTWITLFVGIAIAMLPAGMRAQEDQPKQAEGAKANTGAPAVEPRFYHLDFVVKEVEEGRVLNSRSYSTSISTDQRKVTIRAGSRVPVPTGSGSSVFQYMDVGVNVDCNSARDIAGKLALHVVADVSSVDRSDTVAKPDTMPLVRQFKWEADVVVVPGKPTIIFSSDDATSKRKMLVELTAARSQ